MSEPQTIAIKTIDKIGEISADDWNACAHGVNCTTDGSPANPFVSHAFLHALEASGSAIAETGWYPHHLVIEDDDGKPKAVLPAYLKSHSQGEYVFDHGWADAFERAGGRYYPKLQCSVPFTPATGPRLLIRADQDQGVMTGALATGVSEVCKQAGLSSAHLTFLTKDQWDALGRIGYLQRMDQQFHFVDEGFGNFEGFLAALASRKRKQVKKERREALANDIEIEWITGSDLKEKHWEAFYSFYLDTGARKWGRPYLTRKFFSLIGETMPERTLLIMAKRNGDYVAGALNFIGADTLFGRHWGCMEDHPFLHFECCYYQAIDFALEHGLSRVEAGAQGAHKIARGYLPQTTYSAHFITHPGLRAAIEDYLNRERRQVKMEGDILAEHTPFKRASDD